MFSNHPFWRTTRKLDAVFIWGGGVSFLTWLFGIMEGWGMAISLILAMAALPLALLSAIIFQQRASLAAFVRNHFAPPVEPDPLSTPTQFDAKSSFRSEIDGAAHERLELFIIDHLNPACWGQIELQQALLRLLCNNEKVMFFADQGLEHDYMHSAFCQNASVVFELGGSPLPTLTNGKMIDCITALENEPYREFCGQAVELAELVGIDHRKHPATSPLWEAWRHSHNDLVKEFDLLKRESRFPAPLYRPQKESRWGGIIPPLEGATPH